MVAATSTGESTFGRMCFQMMRESVSPMARAASTNSFCFSERNWARTSRATGIQLSAPMTVTIIMNTPISGPNDCRSGSRKRKIVTSSSGRTGSDKNRSVSRMSGLSRRPK